MIATVAMIVFVVAVAVCLVMVAARGGLSLKSTDLNKTIQPVNVPALMNLLDESQQDYLRSRLPKRDLTRLQRKRNRALLVYVKRILSNSAVLMRYAHAATQSTDAEIAATGRELMQSALRTRIYGLKAIGFLYIGMALPGAAPLLGDTIARYMNANELSVALGRRTGRSVGPA